MIVIGSKDEDWSERHRHNVGLYVKSELEAHTTQRREGVCGTVPTG
jgi:hypothetical protein